jgi:hypothetical protein
VVWSNLRLSAMLTHTHTWNQKPFARLSIFNWTSCASMNSKTSSFVSINGVIIWFQRLPPEKDHRNRGIEGQSLLQIFVNQLCGTIPTRAGGRLCPRDRPKLNITQWPAPPRKNCCRKYPELSNLHKIWNIVHNVNNHIEEKLGSEMFR